MNDLILLKNEQVLTTSLKVAEYFWKRHNDVLRAITASNQALRNFAHSEKAIIKSTYKVETGKSNPMSLLNRDGFTFVAMGFTGEKAAQFKCNYIQAFNTMEAAFAERQSEQWKLMRGATKDGCKELGAAIHELWLFAKANGCKATEDKFHMTFYRLMNKTPGINPKSRDKLPLWKLFDIDRLQFMAKTVIKGLLAKGDDYHLPYQKCKAAFETYARVAFIPQRLLEG